MRKGTFEETLRIPTLLLFAFFGLIAIFLLLGKITGFSAGLLFGALKTGYCTATGGSAGNGAIIGAGGGAALCAAGIALGFVSFGTTAVLACGAGIAIGAGAGAATTSAVC